MKTGKIWFDLLSEEEQKRFRDKQYLQNRNTAFYLAMNFQDFREFIMSAFNFYNSEFDYWLEISKRENNLIQSKKTIC